MNQNFILYYAKFRDAKFFNFNQPELNQEPEGWPKQEPVRVKIKP